MGNHNTVRPGWDGFYELVDNKTGEFISFPCKREDFRGETAVVTGGKAPHKPSSEGFVYAEDCEYYAGVFGLKWVKFEGEKQ